MTCPNCGTPVSPEHTFCPGCGGALGPAPAPADAWTPPGASSGASDALRTWQVAKHFRSLLAWYLGAILLNLCMKALSSWMDTIPEEEISPGLGLAVLVGVGVVLLLALGIMVMVAIHAFKMTSAMGSTAPWAWSLALMVPCCVNLIFLVILNSNAKAWLGQRGVQVGLMGPDAETIERLRAAAGA